MDRFYRGLLSGLAGGIVMNIWSSFSYYILRFSTRRFLDWSAVILYGHLPKDWFEAAYAFLLQLLWVGMLGVIFAFVIRDLSTSQGLLIKGGFFGVLSGFIIYAMPTFFGVQFLEFTPLRTVVSNHIGGLLWGLTMAYSLNFLDSKYKLKSRVAK